MIKISIITVCFNSEKTIEKCLDTIKSQTYPNIKIIIVPQVAIPGSAAQTARAIDASMKITKDQRRGDQEIFS